MVLDGVPLQVQIGIVMNLKLLLSLMAAGVMINNPINQSSLVVVGSISKLKLLNFKLLEAGAHLTQWWITQVLEDGLKIVRQITLLSYLSKRLLAINGDSQMSHWGIKVQPFNQSPIIHEVVEEAEVALSNNQVVLALNAAKMVTWVETVLMVAAADNLEAKAVINADRKVIWVEIVLASSKLLMNLVAPQLN